MQVKGGTAEYKGVLQQSEIKWEQPPGGQVTVLKFLITNERTWQRAQERPKQSQADWTDGGKMIQS